MRGCPDILNDEYNLLRNVSQFHRSEVHVQGGGHGHYGSLRKPATYLVKAGEPWTVPKTCGVYLNFAAGMKDAEKKREVATFVLTDHNIKKAEVTQ